MEHVAAWNWYINLTTDGAIYPTHYFPFGAAFVCQAGSFWTLPLMFKTLRRYATHTHTHTPNSNRRKMCTCEQLRLDSTAIYRRPLTSHWGLWPNAALVVHLPEICIRAETALIGETPIPGLQGMQPHEHVVLSYTVSADICWFAVNNDINMSYMNYYERISEVIPVCVHS